MFAGVRVPVRLRWVVLTSIAVAGCYAQPRPVSPNTPEIGPSEDRIGLDDTFDVRVYGEPELTGTYRVATDGSVDFPLAGRLVVAGLMPGEVQQLVVKKLKEGYLKDPQVTVTIKDRNSQKISVLGQVARPGQVPYYPHMTIVDAIASAGGFTGIAAKNSVSLRRDVSGKTQTRVFPVADISEGRSPNVTVLPGDVLVVDERVF
jgi:protein involved in polysaccharide export with SLBB domain